MRLYSTRVRSALFRSASLFAIAAISAAMGGGQAFAQEEETADAVEEVVVTGSRTIRDGAEQPTPVTVLAVEQLQDAAPRSLAEGLAQLPAFRNGFNSTTSSSTASYNTAGSFLNLRDLGIERTLVLLDGRRVAPSSTIGGTNVDLLPQPLVRRVDVVTGGASAGYGSDAVAGVVNFILDTDFRGVKGTIQGGISDRGDSGSYKFDISAGTSFFDDRLKVLASFGTRRINPIYYNLQRIRNIRAVGRITRTGQIPSAVFYEDIRQQATFNGVILGGTSAPSNQNPTIIANKQFLPNGVVGNYDPGLFGNGTNQVGGDGIVTPMTMNGLLDVETAFLRAEWSFSDNLKVFLQVATGDNQSLYHVNTPHSFQTAAATIFEDNYFLPAAIRTLMQTPGAYTAAQTNTCNNAANTISINGVLTPNQPAGRVSTTPVRCFRLAKIHLDGGRQVGDIRTMSQDYLLGFTSTIFDNWSLDGYWEHGQNYTFTNVRNNIEFEHYYAAIDTVANPAVNGVAGVAVGAPICRARLTAPSYFANCIPYNPFGFGVAGQEAYDYIMTDTQFFVKAKQDVFAANITGEPFTLPAGPVGFAMGAERRSLSVRQVTDPESNLPAKFVLTGSGTTVGGPGTVRGVPSQFPGVPGGRANSNLEPFFGKYDVTEGYSELNVPLLRDLPLIQELSINGAVRYTDYSTSGPVTTWKVGASYRPNDVLRLRWTLSHDIRAPNSVELFQTGNAFQTTITDPFNNNESSTVFYRPFSNTALEPEVAESVTAGIIFTPTWIPGLTVTLDYYDIQIAGAIENLSANETLEQCFAGSTISCNNIKHTAGTGPYTGAGDITLIYLPYINLSGRSSSGADMEVSWRGSVGPGQFNSRLIFGYIKEQCEAAPGAAAVCNNGTVLLADNPRIRGVLQLAYEVGSVGLTLQERYIGHGYFSAPLIEGLTIDRNRVGSRSYTDVTGKYRFGMNSEFEAFLSVNNLFDKDPPQFPTVATTLVSQTNPNMYDQLGRAYSAGLRFKF